LDAKLDNTDIAIVEALIEDGRKSFRQIASGPKSMNATRSYRKRLTRNWITTPMKVKRGSSNNNYELSMIVFHGDVVDY
jgi:hypothetical protein